MSRGRALSLFLVLAMAPFAGCLDWIFGADDEDTGPTDVVDPGTPDDVLDRLANVFKNYTFGAQAALPPTTLWYNDTIGPDANLGVEATRDDGGTDFNGVVKTMDVSPFIPVGQPTEIAIQLFWNAAEGQSADIDIFVDVPGLQTSTFHTQEELNFNIPVRTMTVNTVGVAGHAARIGVQAANGRTTGEIPFHIELSFSYAKDALTPYHPYAFEVPANASGLILESVKAAGDEHVSAKFVILDPSDEVVTYMEYNDIAIPTESVFIPIRGPGEYVFYAWEMRGGFLSLNADVGLDKTATRILALKEERVVDATGPAPGTVSRSWLSPNEGAVTPRQGATVVDVNLPFFPLAVRGFIDASGMGGATVATQVAIESPRGLVSEVTRILRADTDMGTLGYTDDEGQNNVFRPENLVKGPYKITIVNNGAGAVGHTVLSYTR